MKQRFLPLLLSLTLLLSALPAAAAADTPEEDTQILYVTGPEQAVSLSARDFQLLCRRQTGQELDFVIFSPTLSAQQGGLWYRLGRSGSQKVTSATPYYAQRAPGALDDLSFLPAQGFTGTLTVPFTGQSDRGESFSGTLTLHVPAPSYDLALSAQEADPFQVTLFNDLCREQTRSPLRLVTFDAPTDGRLVYRQEEGDSLPITERMTFYTDPAQGRALSRVSFDLSAAGREPYVLLPFTGESMDGGKFSATLRIDLPKSAKGSVVCYTPVDQPLSLDGVLDQYAPLTLALPLSSQGTLWLDYDSDAARKLLPGETVSPADLTYVPAAGTSGTVQLEFRGLNARQEEVFGILAIVTGQSADVPAVPFRDLEGWAWAAPAAGALAARGALPAGQGDLFRPGDNATRIEVIYALTRLAYGRESVPSGDLPPFPDLPADSQYANAAAVAHAHGILLGDEKGRILPDSPITRQDVLVLCCRAMTEAGKLAGVAPGDLSGFTDAGDLAAYAREPAALLLSAGVLQGSDTGALDPTSPITRAEMAVLLCRAFPQ